MASRDVAILLHRSARARENPRESRARYGKYKGILKKEYTPVHKDLCYEASDERVKRTEEKRRPETHTDDIEIEPDNKCGLSVYCWNDTDQEQHPKVEWFRNSECFCTPLRNLKHGLGATFTGTQKWIGGTPADHYVVHPTRRMTLGAFDSLWQEVVWQLCEIRCAGEKDDFWYPRSGNSQILSLEGILHLAIVYLDEEDPNDLSAVDLYSRARSDKIKSLADVVQCGLGEVCVQLLQFVVDVEECCDEESAEDSCEVILDGESLLHFLKEEIAIKVKKHVSSELKKSPTGPQETTTVREGVTKEPPGLSSSEDSDLSSHCEDSSEDVHFPGQHSRKRPVEEVY